MPGNINTQAVINRINGYIDNRKHTLDFFSKIFDRTRGKRRAKIYIQLLENKELTPFAKNVIIYALLSNLDGSTLQLSILKQLGYEKSFEGRIKAKEYFQNEIKEFLKQTYPNDDNKFNNALKSLNENVIANIVKYANADKPYHSKNFKDLLKKLKSIETKSMLLTPPKTFTICPTNGRYNTGSDYHIIRSVKTILKNNNKTSCNAEVYSVFGCDYDEIEKEKVKIVSEKDGKDVKNAKTVHFCVVPCPSGLQNLSNSLSYAFSQYIALFKAHYQDEHKRIPQEYTFIFPSHIAGNHYAVYACNFRGEILVINSLNGKYERYDNAAINTLSLELKKCGVHVEEKNIFRLTPKEDPGFEQRDASICGGISTAMAIAISCLFSFKEQLENLKVLMRKLCGTDNKHYHKIRQEHQILHNLSDNKEYSDKVKQDYLDGCEYTIYPERLESMCSKENKSEFSAKLRR